MIRLTNTNQAALDGVKVLVHSKAGYGKTTLCATAPRPLIISNESGLLSLTGHDIPAYEIDDYNDLVNMYNWVVGSEEANQFDTICLDSISEMGEVVLGQLLQQHKDGRQAYGQLNRDMEIIIRLFRDIKGKNVYFTAKEQRVVDDDSGKVTYTPSMPGKTLLRNLPFFFDEVFNLRIEEKLDDQGVLIKTRYLQTDPDPTRECKDRSGRLDPIEPPNLGDIFHKIIGKTKSQGDDNGIIQQEV